MRRMTPIRSAGIGLRATADGAKRLDELARIDASLWRNQRSAEASPDRGRRGVSHAAGLPGGLEADPARLETVENRLATIDKLKRKYGGTVDRDPAVSGGCEEADQRSGDSQANAAKNC